MRSFAECKTVRTDFDLPSIPLLPVSSTVEQSKGHVSRSERECIIQSRGVQRPGEQIIEVDQPPEHSERRSVTIPPPFQLHSRISDRTLAYAFSSRNCNRKALLLSNRLVIFSPKWSKEGQSVSKSMGERCIGTGVGTCPPPPIFRG